MGVNFGRKEAVEAGTTFHMVVFFFGCSVVLDNFMSCVFNLRTLQ